MENENLTHEIHSERENIIEISSAETLSDNRPKKRREKTRSVLVKFSKLFNTTTTIACCALIVSVVTTTISILHANEQSLLSRKTELRTLLQRMIMLPREFQELKSKYAANFEDVGGSITQENILLYYQAVNLLNTIPSKRISAIEYYSIAYCALTMNNYEAAINYGSKALPVVTDMETEMSIHRLIAGALFGIGKFDEGRKEFENAIKSFDAIGDDHVNEFYKNSSCIYTEIMWANRECYSGNFSNMESHIENAKKYLEKLPFVPERINCETMIANAENTMNLIIQKTLTH